MSEKALEKNIWEAAPSQEFQYGRKRRLISSSDASLRPKRCTRPPELKSCAEFLNNPIVYSTEKEERRTAPPTRTFLCSKLREAGQKKGNLAGVVEVGPDKSATRRGRQGRGETLWEAGIESGVSADEKLSLSPSTLSLRRFSTKTGKQGNFQVASHPAQLPSALSSFDPLFQPWSGV